MKKLVNLKFLSLVTASILSSSPTYASQLPELQLSCGNAKEAIEFAIFAAFSQDDDRLTSKLYSAALSIDGDELPLACIASGNTAQYPDQIYTTWKCKEIRSGSQEGLFRVTVESGGFAGLTTAYLSQDQVYPLPPQQTAVLTCPLN